MHGPGLCHSRQGKRIAGCNLKARAMGFEPTQFALVKLESVPTAGMTKTALKASKSTKQRMPAWISPPCRSQRTLLALLSAIRKAPAVVARALAGARPIGELGPSPLLEYTMFAVGSMGKGLPQQAREKTLAGCNWS